MDCYHGTEMTISANKNILSVKNDDAPRQRFISGPDFQIDSKHSNICISLDYAPPIAGVDGKFTK